MKSMRTSRSVVLILILCGLASSASAQTDKVDDYVKAQMDLQKIPGLSIAVVRNGEIVKAKGYGLANVELNVPAKPETVYQSGSMGKQFTATAVMMLVEEGKIALDDKISKYFSDSAESWPESWNDITVRNLLTHTAGTTDYPKDFDFRRDYTEAELLKKAQAIPLAFAPGEKWSYSNIGYVTLGILISKVSGKFYGEFLQERIFKPLGMTSTRIINEADIVPNRAAGYRMVKGELKNQEWVSPSMNTTADGSLYLTVLDVAKWDAALYAQKLLKRSSLDQMWTPVKLNNGNTRPYGFGWAFGDVGGHKVIEHGGAWQGFTSHIARYVDERLTVIVLTNRAGANPGTIAHGIEALYNSEPIPAKHKEAQLDPRSLDQFVGRYELEPGFVLSITRTSDHLWLHGTGLSRVRLFPETQTKFFAKVLDTQVTFVKDASGKVTHLIFHQRGDREALRVK
ncbi:MAG TPA: serine hydrolase [Blastocatellia bacterium]|nr:serine hydrolase [Blastocatellia bacterium]